MKKNKKNRLQAAAGVLAPAVLLVVQGCMVVPIDGHVRVPDWPELKVIEHHVVEAEMRDQCVRFAPPLTTAAGCTIFDFDRREAHIYVSKDFPNASVLRHERLHAAGHDHVGSDHLHRAWVAWKALHHRRHAALAP
jgi:hypothetical protein